MSDPPRTGSPRAVFVYDGIAIGVSAGRAADLEWLSEALAPAFSVSERGGTEAVRAEVHFAIDADRFAEIERRGPAVSGGPVKGLILDDSTEHFRRWSDGPRAARGDGDAAPAVLTARDVRFPVFYEVGRDHRVRITSEAGETSRVTLMRVVREYVMDACLRRGEVFLHAAALCVEGFAILFAGEKASGKTTTLSWSLGLLEDSCFIANDRVRVRDDGQGALEVRAMPTIMSLRPEGFDLLPALGEAVLSDHARFYLSRREVRERDDVPPLVPFVDGRYGLSPARVAELLGRESVGSAPAGAIVFPEIAPDAGGLHARPLDPAEAAARLERALFSAGNLGRASELFSFPEAGPYPSEEALRGSARRIARRVPAWVWRVGPDAPRDAPALGRFVRDVARRRSGRDLRGA